MFKLDPIHYILATLVVALTIFSVFQWSKISSLEEERDEDKKAISSYESAILYQNTEVEENRVNKKKALHDLSEWQALPVEIKYKTIYRTVYKDINITNKEVTCEENKLIEANTYKLDWNNI